MKSKSNLVIFLVLFIPCFITSCTNNSQNGILDEADCIMESHPDSALSILKKIDKSKLGSNAQKARYALLMSMALDKNYIDTTTFDIIQPAIDYYLDKGTPNEKIRTYYYQGRIFQNQGDRDNALNSFINGIDLSSDSNDSLCIARTLVAQGGLYYEFYDFNSYTNCYLNAAQIYQTLSHNWHEFDCLLNALNGAILSENKILGDSILLLCNKFNNLDKIQEQTFRGYKLSHAIKFGNITNLKRMIELQDNNNMDTNGMLNLALAYHKVGNDIKAKQLLDNINSQSSFDKLKYQAILVHVLENMGNYKDALTIYKNFSYTIDSINTFKFDQKAQVVEDRHKLELKVQQDTREKVQIIGVSIIGIIFLFMVIIILFLLFRSNKTKINLATEQAKTSELQNKQLKSDNEIALQKAKIIEFENERLKSEKQNLVLENRNLQLERNNIELEAENLAHRVEILENESANLKELMNSQEELPSEVQQAIKVRLGMLNALLTGYIANNGKYDKTYEAWFKDLTDNTNEFMNTNRLAFQVSHPRFIQYFEEHDLTISEINYVCLYAIGLKGKDVGNYIKKRGHVNISSAIRKKLGIDKHETNIGIYVRKLLKEL